MASERRVGGLLARIIAHRGGHGAARQNTLGAYREALACGADAAELDVRLSRDRAPVLGHDPVQWRGRLPYLVGVTSARRLGFLATLGQIFAEPRTGARDVPIVLDVKRPPSSGRSPVRACTTSPTRSGSRCGAGIRAGSPRCPTGIASARSRCCRPAGRWPPISTTPPRPVRTVSLHPDVLSARTVGAAHGRGLRAYAWIRRREAHEPAVRCGVDGLVTDWIADALRAAGARSPTSAADRAGAGGVRLQYRGVVLRIDRTTHDAIVAHARRDHPDEACGVVAGPEGSDRPVRLVPMLNAAMSPTFYEFDSQDLLALYKEMDALGEEPVVIYHSHTATEAYPSRTDVSLAQEPGAHYVLVSTMSLSGAEPHEVSAQFRSYRIVDGVVTEEPVEVIAALETSHA